MVIRTSIPARVALFLGLLGLLGAACASDSATGGSTTVAPPTTAQVGTLPPTPPTTTAPTTPSFEIPVPNAGFGLLVLDTTVYEFLVTLCNLEPHITPSNIPGFSDTVYQFQIRGQATIDGQPVTVNVFQTSETSGLRDTIGYSIGDTNTPVEEVILISPPFGTNAGFTIDGRVVRGGPVDLERVVGIDFENAEPAGTATVAANCGPA